MCEIDEAGSHIQAILQLAKNSYSDDAEKLTAVREHFKALRYICSGGAQYQNQIAEHEEFQEYLQTMLYSEPAPTQESVQTIAWQMLANTMVQNVHAQRLVWKNHGKRIVEECTRPPLGILTEIKLMILYNIYRSEVNLLPAQLALELLADVWQAIVDTKCNENFEFLHFFFERFIVHEGMRCVQCYAQMHSKKRISILEYLVIYLRDDSPNGPLHSFLLQYLSKEFKKKSDCILRTVKEPDMDPLPPREVYALLRVLASISCSEMYAAQFATDQALFINASSLLRALNALGKETTPNMFTPKTKLEEVSPSSQLSHAWESELSFELKSLLVRFIGNLLYDNAANKNYGLDISLMPALLECTNVDGRNPLLREWSLLAIRNFCDGCAEAQNIIANLSQQGEAPNSTLKELNLEMGSLRIKPNE